VISNSKADWLEALGHARQGDFALMDRLFDSVDRASTGLFFLGRALAETGQDIDRAIGLLNEALEKDTVNPMIPHALALALARSGTQDHRRAAVQIWEKKNLPHDLELLGQAAITFELQIRVPIELPELPELPQSMQGSLEAQPVAQSAEPDSPDSPPPHDQIDSAGDRMTHPGGKASQGKLTGFSRRRQINRVLRRFEEEMIRQDPEAALKLIYDVLDHEHDTGDLHFAAGMASELLGDLARARDHLVLSAGHEPDSPHFRTMLGKVYWRSGWDEPAELLWRSLPIEGPYDFGRHYHLALLHAGRGELRDTGTAITTALQDFYYDTRHFYIEQAWLRWKQLDP
jgi:Flp pilus assembly protein TadD